MDPALLAFLIVIAVLSLIPGWITGSILKKYARQDGAASIDWIPFGLLYYGLTRFRHKQKFLLVWAYFFSNFVFIGTIVAFLILRKS